jgi:hypothetical protein
MQEEQTIQIKLLISNYIREPRVIKDLFKTMEDLKTTMDLQSKLLNVFPDLTLSEKRRQGRHNYGSNSGNYGNGV